MSGVKVSLEASLLFDKLWQKVWSIIFKVSELFPLNAKIIQLLFFKSCILVNLWKKIILKWSFLILNTVFYFLMITNTWQFHLSKYQGLCTMWIISISFAYVELLVQVFSQSIRFNLIAWNLPCCLNFTLCLIRLKCVPHSSLHWDCFKGSYAILSGWEGGSWSTGLLAGHKLEGEPDLKGGT